MNWVKTFDGTVQDKMNGDLVCVMPKTIDELRDKIIENAPELFIIAKKFVDGIDEGSNPTRAIYNEFSRIFSKIPKTVLDDERLQIQ